MEPIAAITAITAIASGLRLIDQFRDLVLRFKQVKMTPPSATMEQTENGIILKEKEPDREVEVKAEDLKLDQWDSVRYDALRRRVDIKWRLYHELWSQTPLLSEDEKARIKLRMETIQKELCEDFHQMGDIYERTMNKPLPDHYTLHEICG